MESKKIIQMEKKFILQSYKRLPIVLAKGKGCYIWDKDGKKYLDMLGALATSSIGYANPAVTKAIEKQIKNFVNTTNLYYTEPQVLLAKKLAALSGMQKCFFCNSGSEAVEVAIKLARKHTGKSGIIACENAFHGRTFAALSATWNSHYKDFCGPMVSGFKHIPYNNLSALEKAISKDTAAFIVEPIQGESGILVPDKNYIKEAAKICKKRKILLILDEVQTGCGRTGKFFAFQHAKIKPDIVCLAKGIANGVPLGVVIARKGIDFSAGQQGSTFGGNALACSAALAVISEIEKKKLVQNAFANGNYFMKKLNALKGKTGKIKEVRGNGLMIGVELNAKDADAVRLKCMQCGLLVNSIGGKTLRFLPPLNISKKEIDECIKILGMVLA